MELRETLLDKSFETVVKVLPIPDIAEDAIIALKDFLTEDEVKEGIKNFIDNVLNKDGKIISNISNIKDTIKEEGTIQGISKTVDILLTNIEKSRIIDKSTKNLINDSKNLIVDKITRERDTNKYLGQEEILKNIDNKYTLWEKSLSKLDTKNMIKLQTEITKEYSKLNPTIELLNKINEMNNLYELAKNKVANGENIITDLEREICRKAG